MKNKNVVKNNCHAEKLLLSIPTASTIQGRDPEQLPLRMTVFFKRGFTLIELLVVVLIMGILAAIALPQYQFANTKSQVSTILPLLRNLSDAENIYFLENGAYTDDPRELYVQLPTSCRMVNNNKSHWNCDNNFIINVNATYSITASYCPKYITSYNSCYQYRDFYIRFSFSAPPNTKTDTTQEGKKLDERLCRPWKNSKLGERICSSLLSHK